MDTGYKMKRSQISASHFLSVKSPRTRGWGYISVTQCLPGKHETLSSIAGTLSLFPRKKRTLEHSSEEDHSPVYKHK